MTERKKYTAEFKQRALDLVIDSGRPVAQVCVEIGVNEGNLGNWVRKYRQDHPEEFSDDKPESVAYAEHKRVLKENAKLKQEGEFLSKVSAFFVSKQQSQTATSSSKRRRPTVGLP